MTNVTEEDKIKAEELHLEPEVTFNTIRDITSFSVLNEETKESLFEITGYGLQVRFNREKVQSFVDMENLLEGIKDLFRNLIMQEMFPDNNQEEQK